MAKKKEKMSRSTGVKRGQPGAVPRFKRSSKRLACAVWITLFYAAAGVGLLVVDVLLVGREYAVTRSLNDPAKIHFHILLLPSVAAVLVLSYPIRRVQSVMRSCWIPGVGAALALVAGALIFVIGDARQGFEQRIAPPQSFGNALVRSQLMLIDPWLRAQLAAQRAPLPAGDGPEASRAPLLQDTLPALAVTITDAASAWRPPTTGEEAEEQYQHFSHLLLAYADAGGRSVDWSNRGRAPVFLRDASARAWVAGALTALGLSLPMAWFWTVLFYRIGPEWNKYKASLPDGFAGGAALALTIMAMWMFLKVYSEWYSKFYSNAWTTQGELTVTVFATMAALGLLYVTRVDLRNKGIALTTLLAGLTLVSGVVAKVQPAVANGLAEHYRGLLAHQMVVFHLVLLFLLAGVVFAWYQDIEPHIRRANME